MTYTYECDVAYDCPISVIAEMCEATNATMRVIEAEGPGGGNPFMCFEFDTDAKRIAFINLFNAY